MLTQSLARGEVKKQKEYIIYYGTRSIRKCREKLSHGRKRTFGNDETDIVGFFCLRTVRNRKCPSDAPCQRASFQPDPERSIKRLPREKNSEVGRF